jgi:hypothetical protein
MASHTTSPPTGADCLAAFGIACYQPADLQAQYHFDPLYAAGDNGTGQTIVIFDAYGSPTIRQDLATFDRAFGLPAPPSFNVYMPEGNVNNNYTGLPSPVNFHNWRVGNMISWAFETTLDVDWAHAMAPGAIVDLVVTPRPGCKTCRTPRSSPCPTTSAPYGRTAGASRSKTGKPTPRSGTWTSFTLRLPAKASPRSSLPATMASRVSTIKATSSHSPP